jgi:uncharacterized protein (DUF433 family)/uncharacterized protein YcgL (UPF0745 family)
MVGLSSAIDPRELAAYSYASAARLLRIPPTTIRAWKRGQTYTYKEERRRFSEPIPTNLRQGLSYWDLVEVFILRALRTEYKFNLGKIRDALRIAQDAFGIERLFLHEAFRHDGRDFFLERLHDLVTLSPGQQLVMRTVLDDYLKRVEYADDRLSRAFYPIIPDLGVNAPKLIVINALKSFGQPIVESRGIKTAAILARVDAGEEPKHVIEDFGLSAEEFDQAIRFEAT